MNPEPLIRAIVAAMMLLEDCGPDDVDPDTSARGLENIAHELLRIVTAERSEFLGLLARMAAAESDRHTANFMRSIPSMIGMDH